MHPAVPPQIAAPTVVTSPPLPTTLEGATCGTKMRLRVESAATECEFELCGIFSIRTLVLSTTPSWATCFPVKPAPQGVSATTSDSAPTGTDGEQSLFAAR